MIEERQSDAADLARLRVDVVGSLLRPDALKQAFAEFDAGRLSGEDLRAAQDRAVSDAITRQEQIGLPVVSDGEFRRRHFNEAFSYVAGFEDGELTPISMSQRRGSESTAVIPPVQTVHRRVTGRLQLVHSRPLDEYNWSAPLARTPLKATLINPDGILQRLDLDESARDLYPDRDSLLDAVVEIEREMIAGLIDAGCRYIQIDAPRYGAYLDERWRSDLRSQGEDPDRLLERAVAAENRLIRDFPEQVTFALHICRGNNQSRWQYEGSYAEIAQTLSGARHDRLLLEYDSERAGSFEPLAEIPATTTVVLGLISSKTDEVEAQEALIQKIEQASRFVPLDRLALSPQCGFASVIEGNRLSEETQWRKLEVMMKVARQVWGEK